MATLEKIINRIPMPTIQEIGEEIESKYTDLISVMRRNIARMQQEIGSLNRRLKYAQKKAAAMKPKKRKAK